MGSKMPLTMNGNAFGSRCAGQTSVDAPARSFEAIFRKASRTVSDGPPTTGSVAQAPATREFTSRTNATRRKV